MLRDLLTQTRNLLQYKRSMGLEQVPATPDIERFLHPGTNEPAPTSTAKGPPRFTPVEQVAPLTEIYEDLEGCIKCGLCRSRQNIVAGSGAEKAGLMLIEDQPGLSEDREALPFAGEAGELFDKMLKAINLKRDDVYLTSIVKCRPPEDREPQNEEIHQCLPYLSRQIAAISPAVICVMGPLAAKTLTGTTNPLFRVRGKFFDFHGIPLIASFHPRFLIKNVEMKKASWHDLQMIQRKLAESGY